MRCFRWLLCDDVHVAPIEKEQILSPSTTSYLIVYRLLTPQPKSPYPACDLTEQVVASSCAIFTGKNLTGIMVVFFIFIQRCHFWITDSPSSHDLTERRQSRSCLEKGGGGIFFVDYVFFKYFIELSLMVWMLLFFSFSSSTTGRKDKDTEVPYMRGGNAKDGCTLMYSVP